jgi:hypothetical protein
MGGQLVPAHNKHHWVHQQDICWFLHSDTSYEKSAHIFVVLAAKRSFCDIHLAMYVITKQNYPWPPLDVVVLNESEELQTQQVMSTATAMWLEE